MPQTAALICAYNEEVHLGDIVSQSSRYVDLVIVVDDGSTDATLEITQKLAAKNKKIVILRHKVNQGKGAAQKTGIHYCIRKKISYIVMLDADGQHDPKDIPAFLAKLSDGVHCVVGDREHRKTMPRVRRIANAFSSWLVSTAARQKIHDSQNGFRACTHDVLKFCNLPSQRFDFDTEMLIVIGRKFTFAEVPIKTVYADEVSHFRALVDTFRFFKVTLPYLIWK